MGGPHLLRYRFGVSETPTAAYSIRIRARLSNQPGTLGRLAVAIGEVGGNIWALEGFEAKQAHLDEDVIVNCASEEHQHRVLEAVRRLEGIEIIEWDDRTFTMHQGGKIEVLPLMAVGDRDDLSMAYTPGVARVCKAIEAEPERVHELTIKKNTVAIVTDGTAVLGLGNIGPEAALPVMEGKALLFKEFAGVDGFPICLDASSADEIVESVQRIAPVFGGINLEDIAAPQCFEVEERLKETLDIPIFHDDQHGTAVVVLAALQNALKIVDKKMADVRVVIAGVGAAGVACAKILLEAGVPHVIGADRKGSIWHGRDDLNSAKQWFAENTNPDRIKGTLPELLPGADVFIGVSGPGLLQAHDLEPMARDAIIFALANPDPEIRPEQAAGLCSVMATGRSDFPNQINNVLCFPGIFRGALDAGATAITENMKLAAADAIAAAVGDDQLAPDFIIPSVFDKRVAVLVAEAAAAAAISDGVVRSRPS
jgi:malate dehydrogenase (oxaloacetate-decarboxylating)